MNVDVKVINLLQNIGFTSGVMLKQLEGAGSDRVFIRAEEKDKSIIIMMGSGHGAALGDWVQIQRYLKNLGFAVPKIIAKDLSIPAVIVQDLGSFDKPKLNDYPRIVDELARLAIYGGKNIERCPLVLSHPFDFSAFRWESEYFSQYFLLSIKNIEQEKLSALNSEFDSLAEKLSNLPKYFCHRDFQSSNIAIIKEKIFILDFQSAKHGPLEYDLASLIWDPYIEMPEKKRENLATQYLENILSLGEKMHKSNFWENLNLCAISRLMQALGAFGFLSIVKNKKQFLNYIPGAVDNLKKVIAETGLLKRLLNILEEG